MSSKTTNTPEFSEHSIITLPARRFAGRRVAIDGTNGVTPGTAWEGLSFPIPGQIKGMSYGVCFGETPGGITEYIACAELQAHAPVPDGLDSLTLPADRYFVVRQKMPAGGFGDHLKAGLERLWGGLMIEAGVEPSGNPDLEAYPDDFLAGRTEGWLTYMVPIKA